MLIFQTPNKLMSVYFFIIKIIREFQITSLFPLNGKIIEPEIIDPPKHKMMCTRCKQSDFEYVEKFHEHLFDCARNPEFDTDEDPVPTDTFSESSST